VGTRRYRRANRTRPAPLTAKPGGVVVGHLPRERRSGVSPVPAQTNMARASPVPVQMWRGEPLESRRRQTWQGRAPLVPARADVDPCAPWHRPAAALSTCAESLRLSRAKRIRRRPPSAGGGRRGPAHAAARASPARRATRPPTPTAWRRTTGSASESASGSAAAAARRRRRRRPAVQQPIRHGTAAQRGAARRCRRYGVYPDPARADVGADT
jgi:hypothetical protein